MPRRANLAQKCVISSTIQPQPRVARFDDRLRAVSDLEFGKNVVDVIPNCFRCNAELLRDLCVIESLCDEVQHLTFTLRKFGQDWCLVLFEITHQAFRNFGTKERLAIRGGAKRAQQFFLPCAFENVTARARAHCRKNRVILFEHCEN